MRIYVVNRKEAGGEVFVALVRAKSQAQAIRHVMADSLQAHAASGNEVAAFIHHGGVQDARPYIVEESDPDDTELGDAEHGNF
jgi:hypothetical protein